jgi:hypothetical protein
MNTARGADISFTALVCLVFENRWEVLFFSSEYYFDAGYGTVYYLNYKGSHA